MRIALLSNVTIDVLAGMFDKAAHAVWTPSGFGAWVETALEPPPNLRAFAPDAIFLLLDTSHGAVDAARVEQARTALAAAFPAAVVVNVDLDDLAACAGGAAFYDDRMWRFAAMPWSLGGLRAIRDEILRLLAAMRGEGVRKVLALDLDNTLWAGVVGEDGVAGVRPYTEFQRALKALQQRGVLLVALSRNNPSDVAPLWNDPRMALTADDFVAQAIDWGEKADNLAALAQTLNLGTDAFVFVDDNPAERARMRALRPDVAVPEFPTDAHDLPAFARQLARLYFPCFRVTDADRAKTAQYRAEAARRQFASGRSLDDYLRELEIWVDAHPATADEIPRLAQLARKANQFNVWPHRRTDAELADLAQSPRHLVMSVHAGDRFGDQGIVGLLVVALDAPPLLTDFVLSCRAMHRTIERAAVAALETALVARGVSRLRAVWTPTAKNAPVANLFTGLGFVSCVPFSEGGTETSAWPPATCFYEESLPRPTPLRHACSGRPAASRVVKAESSFAD